MEGYYAMKKLKLNREWHLKNRMPANATIDQRIQWHLAHIEYCKCRPISEKVIEEMKKRKIVASHPADSAE
jgi:hypothetical protein